MITRAIVEEKIVGTNKYKIRIPIFDGTGKSKVSTSNDLLSEATVCVPPNVSNYVNPGDVVFVGFEENDLGKPVILGHLYQESCKTNTCMDIQARSVNISDKVNNKASKAVLPGDTTIAGIDIAELERLLFYYKNKDNIQ